MGTVNDEIQKMRKFIQDLHLNVTEKENEIFKLKMHLSDDVRTRQTLISNSKKHSLNVSRDVGGAASNQVSVIVVPDEQEQRFQEENLMLKEQIQEQREYHAQEIAQLQAQMRSDQQQWVNNSGGSNGNGSNSQEQERIIVGLREDCLRMQEEV